MKDLVEIVPGYSDKVGNMSVSVLAARDAESAGYAHYMAKVLAASEAQREENKKLAEIRRIRRGIDPHAQQPSALAILARPKEDDLSHFLRPLVDCQVRDKDGNVDVGAREVTAQEIAVEESRRRSPKNETGQSNISSTTEESREAAANAFMFSPGTTDISSEFRRVQYYGAINPTPVTPPPSTSPSEEKSQSLASRVFHWLWKRGVPVQLITKKELSIKEADKS